MHVKSYPHEYQDSKFPRRTLHCNEMINVDNFSCQWFNYHGWSVHAYCISEKKKAFVRLLKSRRPHNPVKLWWPPVGFGPPGCKINWSKTCKTSPLTWDFDCKTLIGYTNRFMRKKLNRYHCHDAVLIFISGIMSNIYFTSSTFASLFSSSVTSYFILSGAATRNYFSTFACFIKWLNIVKVLHHNFSELNVTYSCLVFRIFQWYEK